MTIPYDLPDRDPRNVFPRSQVADSLGTLRTYLRFTEEAMKAEGISEQARKRVINRLIWGEPEGYVAIRQVADEIDATEALARLGPDPEWLAADREQQIRKRAEEMPEP